MADAGNTPTRLTEPALVLLTAGAFEVCDRFPRLHGPFIAAAVLFWGGYILTRWWSEPGVLAKWGFRRGGLLPVTVASTAVLLTGAGGMFLYAALRGPVRLSPHFWLVLLVYPAWGLLQQLLLNALFARHLAARMPAPVAVAVTALLFGLTHRPDRPLTLLTTAAALVWVPIYPRWRNLWPLGLCHSLLSAVAYYVVLRREAWAEVTAALR